MNATERMWGVASPNRHRLSGVRAAERRVELGGVLAQRVAHRLKLRELARAAPQPQARVRDREVLAQVEVQLVQQRRERPRGVHSDRQAVHALADHVVLFTELNELGELALERAGLLAQPEHLPVGERDRLAAVRIRHVDPRQQIGVLLEEDRVLLQVAGDVLSLELTQSRSLLQTPSRRARSW
jgi:hypothetical protein